jgi:hypothetical protein
MRSAGRDKCSAGWLLNNAFKISETDYPARRTSPGEHLCNASLTCEDAAARGPGHVRARNAATSGDPLQGNEYTIGGGSH